MPSIYNSQDIFHKSPFGAVQTGQEVTFTLRLPKNLNCKTPVLFLEADGQFEAQQYPLYAIKNTTEDSTVELFSVKLSVEIAGLYFYWFDLWSNYQKLFKDVGGEAILSTSDGKKFPLTVYNSNFETPPHALGGVMYHIFPDRFFEGNPDKPYDFRERIYRQDKQNPPYFWGETKSYGSLTLDYYGGDLAGIQKRLPFLYSLGVTWIYLNPICESHSNHRYNTADYLKVDPYLGTNEDFTELCAKASVLGIKIILDGVFSHVGSDSIYFNKEGRYPGNGAFQGSKSPYRSWFHFHADGTYDSWWGFDTLPACDKRNPDFRKFIAGEGGVIDHWINLGASGFRLDVADELPDDFIAEIRTAVKRGGKDNLLIGEVWEDASLKEAYHVRRRYFLGEELDGVMNYPFRTAILEYLKTKDAQHFSRQIMEICENYPAPALHACTTHLSTHDTERAITALAGEPVVDHDRNWQSGRRLSFEQFHVGIQRLKLAFVLQFTLPGIPCVYYGDEIAMQGYADPFNRGYYDWNSSETQLISLMIRLSKLRKHCSVFKSGSISFSYAKQGVLVYRRTDGDEIVEIAVNASEKPVFVQLLGADVPVSAMNYAIRSNGYDFYADNRF